MGGSQQGGLLRHVFGLHRSVQEAQCVSLWDSVLLASGWNGYFSTYKCKQQADRHRRNQLLPSNAFRQRTFSSFQMEADFNGLPRVLMNKFTLLDAIAYLLFKTALGVVKK